MKLTTSEFINRSKKVHGDKYDYSKVNYVNYSTEVDILCVKHGVFRQKAGYHLSGSGCPICAKEYVANINRKSTNDFVDKAVVIHGNRYKYTKSVYKHNNKNIIITCNKHGDFSQTPNNHLSGSGCPICAVDSRRSDVATFIQNANEVHNNYYNYVDIDYKDNKKKIVINCPKHGNFSQTPNNHLRGHGCPKCKLSKGEIKIEKYLSDNNISYIQQYKFSNCKNKTQLLFDFYLTDKNICLEYDGEQHFEVFRFKNKKDSELKLIKIQKNDNIKNKYCEDNDIKLIRIPY
jgi:hypothetical protein